VTPPARPLPLFLRALPLGVAVLAGVVFAPALGGEFLNWDDDVNFVQNPHYRGLGWAQIRWAFTATLMGHWIPLTWLSLGVNYLLGGMDPWGYHLGNMLLHGANAGLFCAVARRLLGAALAEVGEAEAGRLRWGAAFAAVVFGVHPLRVESVAWITERRDVLCGMFFLLAVLAYLRYAEAGAGRRGWWLGASVAAFAAALLSKAAAMPLPVALLILDVYPLRRVGREGWRRLLLEKLPYAVLAAVAAAVALMALHWSSIAVTPYARYGLIARVAMTAYSLAVYPWKFLWPAGLIPIYELPPVIVLLTPRFLVPAGALIVVTAALVALRRRWPAGLAAWTYSAVMVLPVSGLVHAGHQLAHDRYSYLSGLGFALLAGAGLVWLLRAPARGLLRRSVAAAGVAAAILVVAGLGGSAWRQSRLWRDSETLWRWAVDVDPACAVCANNLGAVLIVGPRASSERLREAEPLFRRAAALRPDWAFPLHNLGVALVLLGRLDDAEAAFVEYMRRAPGVAAGPGRLGMLRVDQKRYAEAVELLRRAYAMDPRFPGIRRELALALGRRAEELRAEGKMAEAETLAREADGLAAEGPGPAPPSRNWVDYLSTTTGR
jgi:Tfp pilus assembly protein PilF